MSQLSSAHSCTINLIVHECADEIAQMMAVKLLKAVTDLSL
jgi:hypothetical protein